MKFFGICIFLFAVLAVSFAALSTAKKEKLKSVNDQCQADPNTKMPEGVLEKLQKGEATDEEKHQIAKHALCMNVKMGIQKENGDIDADVLRKEMEEDAGDKAKVEEIMTKCGTRRAGDTAGVTAMHLAKCIYETLGVKLDENV